MGMSEQEERRKIIYALWCPVTRQYRYVGASVNPESRWRQHCSLCGANAIKRQWVKWLRTRGLKPRLVFLDDCAIADGKELENAWILRLMAEGHELLNAVYPGYSYRQMCANAGRYRSGNGYRFINDQEPLSLAEWFPSLSETGAI